MADSFTFKLVGAEQLAAKLRQAGGRARPIIAGALWEIGQEIMGESQQQVPVLTGALKNSGRVFSEWGGQMRTAAGGMGSIGGADAAGIGTFGSADDVTVTLGYGGAALGYALAVHETPSSHDPPSWEGKTVHFTHGKAHFLSDPVKARAVRFGAQMAVKLRGRLDRALAR